MVVDPLLLDNITQHVQEGYTGANGWRAEHAFIVTWYRVGHFPSSLPALPILDGLWWSPTST